MSVDILMGSGRVLSIFAASVIVACGSGDDDAPGGSAGASGSSSVAGSMSGGSGPGGSSPGGTAGAGGGAGSRAVDVLNPDLPLPSHDCRTDTQSKQCISVRGTLDGEPIDLHCALTEPPTVLLRNPDAWPVACVEGSSSAVGHWYQISVPIRSPGAFSYAISPDTTYGADVAISKDGRGGDVRAQHLVSAAVAGSVERDPTTTNDIIVGTFRGTWSMPAASCTTRLVRRCGPADVHGTFRVEHYLKIEDFP